jgi:hypothetical protein
MHPHRVGSTWTPLPLAYDDVRALAPTVEQLLAGGRRVVLELGPPSAPDLALVAVLARLGLHARRSAGVLVVRGGDELTALLRLTGLAEALGGSVEVDRHPALLEDLGPEEVVDVRDAPG